MRLLFVSSTTVGGSGRSQRELADELDRLGHQTAFLVDDARPRRMVRWLDALLSDAAVRLGNRRIGAFVQRVERRIGMVPEKFDLGGRPHLASPLPENALPAVLRDWRPDVVIGNSLVRLSWRRIQRVCRRANVPAILYVREEESLDHFLPEDPPDAVVANSESLVAAIRSKGIECEFFPSVIDTSVTRTATSREVALVINPIPSRGVDLVWQIAEQVPRIPIVLQESWPLDSGQIASLEEQVNRHQSVQLRRASPPGPELYADTRVLLVPYRVDNRPRVIAEAQANAIPVIVANTPSLVEATGPGGIVVKTDDVDGWCAALQLVFEDEARYDELCRNAYAHSQRDEISGSTVAQRFETFVIELMAGWNHAPQDQR